jgi:hypothetical protein
MASADLLLHPVRPRIVQAFPGTRALTTSQLAAELDNVPASSLYHHIALPAKAQGSRWSPNAGAAAQWSARTVCGSNREDRAG